jgi:hypothetical protein
MAADGTGLRQLTSDPGLDAVPAWSPDGTRIAFVSERTGDAEVWSMTRNGEDVRNLSRNPAGVDGLWSVAWAPDGRSIAYASAGLAPGTELPVIREDLAVAGTLVHALLVGCVAIVLAGVASMIGATATLLGVDVGLAALIGDDWRFFIAALALGLLVDLAVRRLSSSRRLPGAGGLTAAAFVAVPVVTLGLSGTLSWSPTLGLGLILLAGGSGWAIGSLVALLPRR